MGIESEPMYIPFYELMNGPFDGMIIPMTRNQQKITLPITPDRVSSYTVPSDNEIPPPRLNSLNRTTYIRDSSRSQRFYWEGR